MKYVTPAEYAIYEGCSRQAIEDRMKRGTLGYVIRKVKVEKKLIPVSDDVKLKIDSALALGKEEE